MTIVSPSFEPLFARSNHYIYSLVVGCCHQSCDFQPATGKLLDVYDIPKAVYVSPLSYISLRPAVGHLPISHRRHHGTSCTSDNIGMTSLQGDAKFERELSEKMGCTVSQDADQRFKLQGPPILGGLKAIKEVEMEIMTSASLAATVVAAVADGKTRILGNANQRVKECNRIRAVIDQLGT